MQLPNEALSELERLAPLLNALPQKSDATMGYGILSDALFWSDELPRYDRGDDWLIRALLRYRTSVLLEQPLAGEVLWAAARNAFPSWAGFAVERNVPTPELQAEYHRLSELANREIEESISDD